MNSVVRLMCLVAMLSLATGAHAQGTTFVSAKGVDNASCSITSPCRSLFQGITVVQDGGTVAVVDSGEFDSVDVGKSVTIDATGVVATILTPGTAITVNGTNIVVTLRNLNIDVRNGTFGIWAVNGAVIADDVNIRNVINPNGAAVYMSALSSSIILRNVSITNSGSGTAAGGIIVDTTAGSPRSLTVESSLLSKNSRGIVVQGPGNAQMSITNSTISNSSSHGIRLAPTGGTTKVSILNSTISNNAASGILIAPSGNAKADVTISHSAIDGNDIGVSSTPSGGVSSKVMVADTSLASNRGGLYAIANSNVGVIRGTVTNNTSFGIGTASPAIVRVGSSLVSGNAVGFSGPVSSFGNNQLLGNTTQGSSSPVAPASIP